MPSPNDKAYRHTFLIGLALFFATLSVYLANGRTVGLPADTLPAQYIPWSVLEERDLDLDEFSFLYEGGVDWYLVERGGRHLSSYPILPGLVAVPVYAVADWFGALTADRVPFLAKFTASLFVALSVGFLFSLLRRNASAGWAFALAGAYGFGTAAWVEVSQALWQHGPGLFFLVLGLWLVDRARDRPACAALAALPLAAAVLARPVHLISLVLVAILIGSQWRRQLPGFLLLAAAVGVPMALYNLSAYGTLFGGYGTQMGAFTWRGPVGANVLAHLVSPGRGVLFYSPILALGIVGAGFAWRKRRDPLPVYASIGVVAYLLLYSRWSLWWGGVSYGDRLLSDSLPYWILLMVPIVSWLNRPVGRTVFGILLGVSVAVQVVGATAFDGRWDILNDSYSHHDRFWSLRDNPLTFALREVDPRDDRFRRALEYHFGGDPTAAVALMDAYAMDHGRSASVQYILGILKARAGRTEGALIAFRDALAIDAGHSGAHEEIGRIYHTLGRRDEAESWYERADRLRRASVEMPNASGRSELFCQEDRLGDLIALENRRPNGRINAAYLLDGKTLRFRNSLTDRHLVCGWGPRRREGRPLEEGVAYFRAMFRRPRDMELLIVAKQMRGGAETAREVYLDDHPLGIIRIAGNKWRTYRLAIPAEAMEARLQFLRFLPAATPGAGGAPQPFLVWSLSARHALPRW